MKALVPQPKELSLPKATSKDMFETTHLKMLKWFLDVQKKTNNNACSATLEERLGLALTNALSRCAPPLWDRAQRDKALVSAIY